MRNYNGEFLQRPELEALGVSCGGDDVFVHTSVVIVNTEGLRIGNHVRIDPFCVLTATGGITLGSYIHISSGCILIGGGGIEVGDYATISHGVRIFSAYEGATSGFMTNPMIPDDCRNVTTAPVILKRHSVIGPGVHILAGVTIGEGSVAAGPSSLIRDDIPDWTRVISSTIKSVRSPRKRNPLALAERWIESPPPGV